MADGTTQRGNDNIATDQLSTLNGVDVSGESKPPKVQRVKLGYGADGVYQDVDENHPLLVGPSTLGTASDGAGTAAVTSTSASAVAANADRKGLSVINVGAQTCSLGLGTAAVDDSGIVLDPNGSWDGLISGVLWTGAVNAKTPSGTTTLAVVEL